jgi:hypothetical protein
MTLADLSYSIPPKSAGEFKVPSPAGIDSQTAGGTIRVVPAAGSPAPAGSLILRFKRGATTVSEAGLAGTSAGSRFHVYAESSDAVQTAVAIANPSDAPVSVTVERISASGESAGSATIDIAAASQVAMFLNQISGLPILQNFHGTLRLSTDAPAGIAVTGLRGRYNERGDFLVSNTPPFQETNSALLFPHIVDGAGYSTQFVLFNRAAGQPLSGKLQFYAPSGLPLELSVR